jgi:hypothetical protein
MWELSVRTAGGGISMKFRDVLIILAVLAAGAALHKVATAQVDRPTQAAAVLRTQRIELLDARGIERARLSTEADGEVVLRLMSPHGEIRVKLSASDEGSGLLLLTGATEPGAQVLAKRTGTTLRLKTGDRERVIEP